MNADGNIWKSFLDGNIPLVDYAALTAQEPQDVIMQLMEILEGHDDRFAPSVTMRNMMKRLANDFEAVNAMAKDDAGFYETELKIVDTFRKAYSTQNDITRTKKMTSLDLSSIPKPETTDTIIKDMLNSGMCNPCKQKLLVLLEQSSIKV